MIIVDDDDNIDVCNGRRKSVAPQQWVVLEEWGAYGDAAARKKIREVEQKTLTSTTHLSLPQLWHESQAK